MVLVKSYAKNMFTWDENSLPHLLNVEINGKNFKYDMDVIKDLKPIFLKNDLINTEHSEIKSFLRGYLKRRNIYDERGTYNEEYCILNFSEQRLKVYKNQDNCIKFDLLYTQIDEDFQRNEFVLVYKGESYYFQCKGVAECKLWVNSLIKAKNLYQEDTVLLLE